jgi:hypothetical protein
VSVTRIDVFRISSGSGRNVRVKQALGLPILPVGSPGIGQRCPADLLSALVKNGHCAGQHKYPLVPWADMRRLAAGRFRRGQARWRGSAAQMPGYLVLISTLGGISIFGLSAVGSKAILWTSRPVQRAHHLDGLRQPVAVEPSRHVEHGQAVEPRAGHHACRGRAVSADPHGTAAQGRAFERRPASDPMEWRSMTPSSTSSSAILAKKAP